MEPKVEVYYKKEKDCRKDCGCLGVIVAIVAIVLAFFIGVLLAAVTGIVAAITVGGIIAIIVALAVLLIVTIINAICCKKTDKKKYYC